MGSAIAFCFGARPFFFHRQHGGEVTQIQSDPQGQGLGMVPLPPESDYPADPGVRGSALKSSVSAKIGVKSDSPRCTSAQACPRCSVSGSS